MFDIIGDGAVGVVFELLTRLPASGGYRAIHSSDPTRIVATSYAGSGGLLHISDNGLSAPPTFHAETLSRSMESILDLGGGTKGQALIGGAYPQGGVFRAETVQSNREFPALATAPSGTVYLAVANTTIESVEIYRAPRPRAGATPDLRLAYISSKFPPVGQDANTLAPSITFDDEGNVIVSIGWTHVVGIDDGREWVLPDDQRLAIPIQDVPESDEAQRFELFLNTTRTIAAYGHGRLFSVWGDVENLYTATTWDWDPAGKYFRSILPGKPHWLGVDGALGYFSGQPTPGDQWVIPPRYGYGPQNLFAESPSVPWRSKSVDEPEIHDIDEAVLEWDAASLLSQEEGQFLNVSAFALIGSNCRRVKFEISDRDNSAVFVELEVTSVRESGDQLRPTGADLTTNILCDHSMNWVPGKWANGLRQNYLYLTHDGSVYRIIESGNNWIRIDGIVTLPGVLPPRIGHDYEIFDDRLFWDGFGGDGPPGYNTEKGLRDSEYRFGRIARITIPSQKTAEGYFQIGSALLLDEPALPEETEHFGFIEGWGWQPVTNTTEELGLSGVSSVQHHGRTGQIWKLPHRGDLDTTRDRKLFPMMKRMRQPFILQLQGDDPSSLEYVRLVDAHEFQNITGKRWGYNMALREVV